MKSESDLISVIEKYPGVDSMDRVQHFPINIE